MLLIIINKLKVSSLFWRYRHLIDSKFASNYAEDSLNKRRTYYSDIVNKYSLKVIFEFGCASGPNLKNIKDNTSGDINLIGYDINSSAINLAKKTFDKRKSIFFTELKLSKIENHLKTINYDKIDLIIFDRVLYLLSEKQIINHIKNCGYNPKIKMTKSPIMNQLSYKVKKTKIESFGLNLSSKIKNDIEKTLKLFKQINHD